MQTTLLEHLLINHPEQNAHTLAAMQSGEIRVDFDNLPKDLLARALESVSKTPAYEGAPETAFALMTFMTQKGWELWPYRTKGDLDAFDIALRIQSTELASALFHHPDAPRNLIERKRIASSISNEPLLFSYATSSRPNIGFIKGLMDLGFDPLTLDGKGNTLLHVVDRPELVKMLLDKGVDPTIKNNKGEDAITAWNNKTILAGTRREMETLILEHAPIDIDRVKREFGLSMINVGVQQTRFRLSDAGLAASTLEYNGLSAAEIVMATAIDHTFTHDGYRIGVDKSHEAWKRAVLSTLKMQGVLSSDDTSERATRMREVAKIFFMLDHGLVDRYERSERKRMAAEKAEKKSTHAVIKNTDEEIIKAIGMEPHEFSKMELSLFDQVSVIERLKESGVLREGLSLSALSLLAHQNNGLWTLAANRSPLDQSALLTLAKWGTINLLEDHFEIKDPNRKNKASDFHVRFELPLAHALSAQPDGLGAMLLIDYLQRRHTISEKYVAIAENPQARLNMKDAWLKMACELIEEVAPDISSYIRTTAEHVELSETTPTLSAHHRVRRM